MSKETEPTRLKKGLSKMSAKRTNKSTGEFTHGWKLVESEAERFVGIVVVVGIVVFGIVVVVVSSPSLSPGGRQRNPPGIKVLMMA